MEQQFLSFVDDSLKDASQAGQLLEAVLANNTGLAKDAHKMAIRQFLRSVAKAWEIPVTGRD